MKFIPQIKQKELAEDPSIKFELVDSPSSGEMYTNKKKGIKIWLRI